MNPTSRPHFLSVVSATAATAALRPSLLGQSVLKSGSGPRFRELVQRGMFIESCPLPGETRAEGAVPAHPNGLQIAKDRYLVLYATRSFRGTDDDRRINGWT